MLSLRYPPFTSLIRSFWSFLSSPWWVCQMPQHSTLLWSHLTQRAVKVMLIGWIFGVVRIGVPVFYEVGPGKLPFLLKDNQGWVAQWRPGNLYVRCGKRITPGRSDWSSSCKLFVDRLCNTHISLNTCRREGIQSICWDGVGRQAAGEQSIITAIRTMQRVILALWSVQPDGNRSSSLVLSDSRGFGQRGRHGWVIFDCLSLMCVAGVTPSSDGCDLFYYTVSIKHLSGRKIKGGIQMWCHWCDRCSFSGYQSWWGPGNSEMPCPWHIRSRQALRDQWTLTTNLKDEGKTSLGALCDG